MRQVDDEPMALANIDWIQRCIVLPSVPHKCMEIGGRLLTVHTMPLLAVNDVHLFSVEFLYFYISCLHSSYLVEVVIPTRVCILCDC